ncbi:response regulator [Nonomuraea candida]|uniref:response regulator n=1 Tax=Nonomuraea candida TaxID=359159 RepID=UPI0005BC3B6A|nr:response regulator transcription factor [Nonomuraea candida]
MVSVLIVDDQMLVRTGLAALIRATPALEVAGEAADGETAVAMAAAVRPDVVLMDVRMPGLDGITATERILSAGAGPPPKVAILTTYDLDEYVYTALRAGASGFLLKETPPQQLLAAVQVIAAGDMLFAPTVTRRLIEAYATRPGRAASPAALSTLTGRELQVLRLVARALSNADIAAQLSLSEATIKTHLHRLMSKLGLCSRAQAIVYAYESGLVVPASRDDGG